jgi:hypothetical protein
VRAVVGELLRDQRAEHDLAALGEALVGLLDAQPVEAQLDRRDPPPEAEVEASAAEMVEHADLLGEAQRVVHRHRVDQRAEPQAS